MGIRVALSQTQIAVIDSSANYFDIAAAQIPYRQTRI